MEKKLIISSGEKETLTCLKQKQIFEELANKIIYTIQKLSKQIDFNNLTCSFTGKKVSKHYIGFKGPLGFNN